MAGDQDQTPQQPSEKGRLNVHHSSLNRDLPPTPTSFSIGSPISPLNPSAGNSSLFYSSQYHDDDNGDDDSNNNNNTFGHFQTPPPYSGPITTTTTAATTASPLSPATEQQQLQQRQQAPPQRYPGLPTLNYHLYSPPGFELSEDCTAIKSTAAYLSATTAALVSLIRAQATIPPKPQIHIVSSDFSLKLNLMSLLVPDDVGGGGERVGQNQTQQFGGGSGGGSRTSEAPMHYIRCVAPGEMALRGGTRPSLEPAYPDRNYNGEGNNSNRNLNDAQNNNNSNNININNTNNNIDLVEAWARRFVEDPAPVKSFILERTVANLDTNWLEGQIRTLIASLGYKGDVSVTFPITHARVIIQSPDRVNKFFTNLTTFFAGGKRRYGVVKVVWPFASCGRAELLEEGRVDGSTSNNNHNNNNNNNTRATASGMMRRVCAVQSEDQWWREWSQPIRFAIAAKRTGWVTIEDKLEALMEGKGKDIVINSSG